MNELLECGIYVIINKKINKCGLCRANTKKLFDKMVGAFEMDRKIST